MTEAPASEVIKLNFGNLKWFPFAGPPKPRLKPGHNEKPHADPRLKPGENENSHLTPSLGPRQNKNLTSYPRLKLGNERLKAAPLDKHLYGAKT